MNVEEPVLTGSLVMMNDKQIDGCRLDSKASISGPVDEGKRLPIEGAYIILEFPVNLMAITASGLIGMIVVLRLSKRVFML